MSEIYLTEAERYKKFVEARKRQAKENGLESINDIKKIDMSSLVKVGAVFKYSSHPMLEGDFYVITKTTAKTFTYKPLKIKPYMGYYDMEYLRSYEIIEFDKNYKYEKTDKRMNISKLLQYNFFDKYYIQYHIDSYTFSEMDCGR